MITRASLPSSTASTIALCAVAGLGAGLAACGGPDAKKEGATPGSAAQPAATAAGSALPLHPPQKDCCVGKNECKGKGGCKTASNACAGKNECKGKGGCSMRDCN